MHDDFNRMGVFSSKTKIGALIHCTLKPVKINNCTVLFFKTSIRLLTHQDRCSQYYSRNNVILSASVWLRYYYYVCRLQGSNLCHFSFPLK